MPRAPKKVLKRNGQSDELIHGNLSAAIIDHRIPPGTALQEEDLAGVFGVSRTIIRKVLQRLAHERLVQIVPNRGASVARPTADEARQVFDARRLIERILIERTVERASDAGLAALGDIVLAEKQAQETGDKRERLRLSGEFHRELSRYAANEVLAAFVRELAT